MTTEQLDLLDLLATDPAHAADYDRFLLVVRTVADLNDGRVTVNAVRAFVARHGIDFDPKHYAAFWSAAASRSGPLRNTGEWETCTDVAGRNVGKMQRVRVWVGA